MLYIKWFTFLLINLTTNVLNFPLAPIVVLFANKDNNLPNWLYFFCTPDNSLAGDKDWQTKYRPFLNESNSFKRWINRFRWLHRNKLYGFSASVLGIKYNHLTDNLIMTGDDGVANDPVGKSGSCYRSLYRGDKMIAFQWYYIRQYKRFPNKCIRISIGWKLWGIRNDADSIATFGFSPSPFMHYMI